MSIDILRRAEIDAESAVDEIEQRAGLAAADRFRADIAALLARLEASPRMYAEVDPVPGGSNRLVFYQPIPGGIRVVRVLHGRMDFNAVFR